MTAQWEDSSLPWQNPAATDAKSGRARLVLSFLDFEIKRKLAAKENMAYEGNRQ
jgi:hypothetical protein